MISIVIPAYNESEGLRLLYARLAAVAPSWREDYEFLLIDDGSGDDTLAIAEELARQDRHWKVISLSRNFGHQAAVTAGLEHASGDLVAVIDADLQDPPEELHRFFQKCREGYDIVFAIRTQRKEGLFKRICYKLFYRLLASIASIKIPLDSGDFCVMNRRALDALNALPERGRFIRGLRSWIGFRQTGLAYERQARAVGEPKYTFRKLVNLALDGLVNFSDKPLRFVSLLGVGIGVLAIFLALLFFVQYVGNFSILGYNPRNAPGWPSLIVSVLFLSSVQLFCLGILGEYMGRLFTEVKGRPVYLVERTCNLDPRVSPTNSEVDSMRRLIANLLQENQRLRDQLLSMQSAADKTLG